LQAMTGAPLIDVNIGIIIFRLFEKRRSFFSKGIGDSQDKIRMKNAYIIDAIRTPFGRYAGGLAPVVLMTWVHSDSSLDAT
jgi:hypothetical protein